MTKKKTKAGDANTVFNDAYNASASVGRIMSWLQLAGGIFISIILIIIGIVLVRTKNQYDRSTSATITETSCSGSGNSSSCTLTVSYIVGDKKLSGSIVANGVYNVGQTITIKYSSTNLQDITTNTTSPGIIGWIFIVVGIFILIGSGIWFYIIQNNNTIAAASGVGNVAGVAVGAFDTFDGD